MSVCTSRDPAPCADYIMAVARSLRLPDSVDVWDDHFNVWAVLPCPGSDGDAMYYRYPALFARHGMANKVPARSEVRILLQKLAPECFAGGV